MNKTLHATKFLELKSTDILGGNWFYAHRPNAQGVVIILPVIKNEYTVFLKTKRPPLIAEDKGLYSLELPAGLLGDEDKNEDLKECAKKEILEEIGMKADKIDVLLNNVSSSGGLTDETCTIVKAEIKNDEIIAEPVSDGGVIVERIKVKIDNIKEFIKKESKAGTIISAQTLATLWFLRN